MDKEFERQKQIWKLSNVEIVLTSLLSMLFDDVLHLADVWLGYVELLTFSSKKMFHSNLLGPSSLNWKQKGVWFSESRN